MIDDAGFIESFATTAGTILIPFLNSTHIRISIMIIFHFVYPCDDVYLWFVDENVFEIRYTQSVVNTYESKRVL